MRRMMTATRFTRRRSDCFTDSPSDRQRPAFEPKLCLCATSPPETYKELQKLRLTAYALGSVSGQDVEDLLRAAQPHVRSLVIDMTIPKCILAMPRGERLLFSFSIEDVRSTIVSVLKGVHKATVANIFCRPGFAPTVRPFRVQLNFPTYEPSNSKWAQGRKTSWRLDSKVQDDVERSDCIRRRVRSKLCKVQVHGRSGNTQGSCGGSYSRSLAEADGWAAKNVR
jgi:hypothetical protein